MPHTLGIRKFLVAGLTALAVVVSVVPDQVSASEAVAAPVPVTLMQFRSFMAPIAPQSAAKPCLKAVTIIVEIGESETRNVCGFMPRIRDAVLVELFRQPIVLEVDAESDFEAVEARLLDPLNQALGKDTVRRVYVIPGPEHLAQAAAAVRLPFSRMIGCRQRRDSGA